MTVDHAEAPGTVGDLPVLRLVGGRAVFVDLDADDVAPAQPVAVDLAVREFEAGVRAGAYRSWPAVAGAKTGDFGVHTATEVREFAR